MDNVSSTAANAAFPSAALTSEQPDSAAHNVASRMPTGNEDGGNLVEAIMFDAISIVEFTRGHARLDHLPLSFRVYILPIHWVLRLSDATALAHTVPDLD